MASIVFHIVFAVKVLRYASALFSNLAKLCDIGIDILTAKLP